MTDITATTIQSELNSTVAKETIEIIIDSAIDTVNSDAGTTITYMTGVAGSKTVTVTGNEAAALKPLIAIKLASRITQGATSSSYALGSLSTSSSVSTSASDINLQLYEAAIARLRKTVGIEFVVAEDTTGY
jgi:hypothetical protein